ncbi:transposase [Chryseobacterium indologenes]|uniref:Transposase n=1 Tax=Chryseobacterium indologenes TaxID=253 RepID=A0AAD1DUQ4_CHRID|nr:DDE-type integrase/transposase/recombinase [Chryseobacterium indologenes]AZB17606.1 transposase [Chryseobacterium indologenes]
MNLQPTDILIRQSNGTESLWLSERLIIDVCGLEDNYLKVARIRYKKNVRACDLAKAKDFMPDSGKSWRWGKQSGQFYYCLTNIPNKAPKNYRNLFGDSEALLDAFKTTCKSKEDTSLEIRFKKHLKVVSKQYAEFYKDVNDIQRIALSKACAVLDFILDEKDNYPGTANKIYRDLSPILSDLDLQYIPHNYLKLKEKITILETTDKAIVDIIHLPRTGNNNAEIYNDPEVFSWVMQLRSMPQNFSNEHIIRKVTDLCEMTTKKTPSRRWFGQTILELPKTQFLTGLKRFGASSSKSHIHKSYVPFQTALFAGDCWEMDATRINMISHEGKVTYIDKNGKEKTKKVEKYINVVAVRDVYSGDILGYSFDYDENHVVYLEAMKMAVQNAGYLPHEWVTDRFPGHNTPQMTDLFERMESLGVTMTFSSHANKKAAIERWFRTLQSVFLMDSAYFYGEGIKSRAAYAHRSSEYLKRIKKEAKKTGWDLQQNIDEASLHIEKYRNTAFSRYSRKHATVHSSPSQLHEYCEKPHVSFIPEKTISMLFGLRKEITIRSNGQFVTEFVGLEFDYMISPAYYDIISNYFNKKVVVTYDLNDLSIVFLWEKNGNLLKSLCEAEFFEKVQNKGKNPELGKISQAKARAKAIAEMKENELAEMIGEDSSMMGIYTDKKAINAFEDSFNDDSYSVPLRKASGADYTPEDIEDAILKNTSQNY